MPILTHIDKAVFLKLLNRGGYVLNFSTSDFDFFTMESIGVSLCEKYQLSKGKSLLAYISEAPEMNTIKLLRDLLNYYEIHYEHEIEEKGEYSRAYKKCRAIMDSILQKTVPMSVNAATLKDRFSSEYLSSQIDLMLSMQSDNPTEAIGKAKELIESCCKTILDEKHTIWEKNWDVSRLAGETIKLLKLMPNDIPDSAPAAKEMKALLGHLRAIANSLAALRNPYGSGHGKSAKYKGLEERHAKLAVGSSITLVGFLWDTYEKREL